MNDWVTADQILADSGAASDPASARPADREWAEAVAGAVSAGVDVRLEGTAWTDPDVPVLPADLPPELTAAARLAGIEAYKRREATFGITGYVDLQGAAIRVARDWLEAIAPIIRRYATVGIA